ncbi:MAG: hypothetical protein K8J08_09225 [Thermoanaerobaculia bacterium]|nr:hypothetical protein [Thermoanaerobaculia bacterium]
MPRWTLDLSTSKTTSTLRDLAPTDLVRHLAGTTAALLVLIAGLLLSACNQAPDATPSPETVDSGSTPETMGPNPCEAKQTWAAGFQSDGCLLVDGNPPPITPIYWPDVCTPTSSAGWTPTQSSFDQLSWRSFLNANWPALPDGQPDTSQSLGTEVNGVYSSTVWEGYKSVEDLYATGAESLTRDDYTKPSALPAACDPAGPRVLTMTSKVHGDAIRAVLSQSDDAALSGIDQAFRGPLYPQGPEPLMPVFYEIRINEVEFDAIVTAQAQSKSPDELNCAGKYQDPTCIPFTFPLESTEVKAAWKVLSSDEISSDRFFYQELQVVDPATESCSVQPMGLVGMHIARKVSHSISGDDNGRQNSWAWATFEHNDNVPPVGGAEAGSTYSFFNANCTPAVDAATCAAVTAPNDDPAYQCCENLYRFAGGTVPSHPTPDQVTRIDDSPPLTQACNAVYNPLDKGVFDSYSLVVTQWPKLSDGPYPATVTPTHARNSVIETYFTQWSGGVQVNASSCMGCHSGSSAVDMSYLFLNNVGK